MSTKKTVKAMMATSLVLALPTIPMANTATDRALFEMNARNGGQTGAPIVRAGHAPIDDAVARIVPAPYRILMDESVPASMQLVWGNGENWMEVLRRSLTPVGLVAEPDWANNTIKISWKKKSPAPVVVEEQYVAAAPATPAVQQAAPAEHLRSQYAQGLFTQSASVSASATVPAAPVTQSSGFVVSQQQVSQTGGFVVTKPAQVAVAPAPRQVSRVSLSEAAAQASKQDASERFVASATGDLPSPDVMWRLMKAAVNGEKIVLSGVSSLSNKEQRARYGEMYASKLRAKLLEVGFPSNTVVLGERQSDRANKAGVRIMVSKEEA